MSFPNNLSVNVQYSKIKVACLSGSVLVSILLTAGCLSTLISFRYDFELFKFQEWKFEGQHHNFANIF